MLCGYGVMAQLVESVITASCVCVCVCMRACVHISDLFLSGTGLDLAAEEVAIASNSESSFVFDDGPSVEETGDRAWLWGGGKEGGT